MTTTQNKLLTAARDRLGSLKWRLALASISVIGLSVGSTAVLVVQGSDQRAEQTIRDSALDVGTISQTIGSRVLTRELALGHAARQWPAEAVLSQSNATSYLSGESVLSALFSRLWLVDSR